MQNSKISRLARLLRRATVLGMIGLIAFYMVLALFLIAGNVFGQIEDPGQPMASFSVSSAIFIAVVSGACSIYALEQLRRLFSCYCKGNIVSDTTARHIQNAGAGLFWAAVLEILRAPIAWLAVRVFSEPKPYAEIDGGFGSAEVGFLFAAGVLTVIGWAMSEAARMADENRAFV